MLVSAEDLDRCSEVAMAQCEDCGLTYAVDAKGSPTTDYPYTCDDCSGYVDIVDAGVAAERDAERKAQSTAAIERLKAAAEDPHGLDAMRATLRDISPPSPNLGTS